MNNSTAEEFKTFNLRITRDLWLFLKKHAADRAMPMTEIATDLLVKYRKKVENKLTQQSMDV